VLTVLAAFAFTIFAREQKERERAMQAQCAHNLKGIGNQFHFWADFKDGYFPMSLSQVIGGSEEFSTGTNAWRHFQVMSNELSTPKVLMCPKETDHARFLATNFIFLNNSNLSFFVGIDADETNASALLSGDHNITNGTAIKNGLLKLTAAQPTGWTVEMHNSVGNICLADGSVQQVSMSGLQNAVTSTGMATNVLNMPVLGP